MEGWTNTDAEGYGVLVFSQDGSIYNGEFHNNYPEGVGILYYGRDFKGDVYSGEFLKG